MAKLSKASCIKLFSISNLVLIRQISSSRKGFLTPLRFVLLKTTIMTSFLIGHHDCSWQEFVSGFVNLAIDKYRANAHLQNVDELLL
jgi:hypothetical protein